MDLRAAGNPVHALDDDRLVAAVVDLHVEEEGVVAWFRRGERPEYLLFFVWQQVRGGDANDDALCRPYAGEGYEAV